MTSGGLTVPKTAYFPRIQCEWPLLKKEPCTIYLQIAQQSRFWKQGNVEGRVQTNRGYIDTHLPAMHIAGDEHIYIGEVAGGNIVKDVSAHFPFRGKVKVAAKVNALKGLGLKPGKVRLWLL